MSKLVTLSLLNDFHEGLKNVFASKTILGETNNLTTDSKNNLVEAINELKTAVDNAGPSYELATIEDIQSILNGTYSE